MSEYVVPFEPRRFQAAAGHYHARPAYAARIFESVGAACGLLPTDRIMDLGCGPGPLTVGFAPLVTEVVAVDPEPNMLSLLRNNTAAFADKVTAVHGSSNDLGPELGAFRMVVMGRSFHWMDRVDTLKRLDALIVPGGAVVLFDESHIKAAESRWMKDYHDLVHRYADATGPAPWRGPDWVEHEAVIINSAFSDMQRIGVIERVTTPAESLVDRALSMSRTAPDRLGPEKTGALVGEIHALIDRVAVDGNVTEILETSALIARRPG